MDRLKIGRRGVGQSTSAKTRPARLISPRRQPLCFVVKLRLVNAGINPEEKDAPKVRPDSKKGMTEMRHLVNASGFAATPEKDRVKGSPARVAVGLLRNEDAEATQGLTGFFRVWVSPFLSMSEWYSTCRI